MFRRRRPPDPLAEVQPAQLDRRWGAPVQEALAARRRFLDAVGRAPGGGIRDRLEDLRSSLDEGVLATWAAAQRAQALDRASAELDLLRITDEHKEAKRQIAIGNADPGLEDRAAALAERHAAAQRLLNSVDDAARELAGLEARLDALSVRATEIVLTGGLGGAAHSTTELDGVLDELRAVRLALDELG